MTEELQRNYAEETRRNKEDIERRKFYEDVRKIRKIAQYFFWLSIISLISWFIIFLFF